MKYAVTAATGHFGQAAVKELNQLVGSGQVVVIVRNAEKAAQLFPANEVRVADYGDQAAPEKALAGIDRVLFVSSQPGGAVSRDQQHRNVVAALKAAKVARVVYTSFPHADRGQSWLAADHRLTEQLLAESGLTHAVVRNNWYLENEASFLKAIAAGQAASYWTAKPMGWALESEYAAGAARVLVADRIKEVYEFAGPIITYAALGAAAAAALGTTGSAKQVSKEAYVAELEAAGFDHATAALYASFQEPAETGDLSVASDDLATVLGRPLTPLAAAIKQVVG